jgi:hypothetical protein
MMKFELEDNLRGATDDELLDELRRCAKHLARPTVTIAEFAEYGKCHPSTIQRRFKSWPKALARAGLQPSRSKIGIEDEELFGNLKALWTSLGHQPRYSEVRSPDSKYSVGTYENRFGSWAKALAAFVAWVNGSDSSVATSTDSRIAPEQEGIEKKEVSKHRTRREISERQRFRILVRDGFRCRSCGASPLEKRGVELHVDHILPWSKGGETVDENLECKCARCNLGKNNVFNA